MLQRAQRAELEHDRRPRVRRISKSCTGPMRQIFIALPLIAYISKMLAYYYCSYKAPRAPEANPAECRKLGEPITAVSMCDKRSLQYSLVVVIAVRTIKGCKIPGMKYIAEATSLAHATGTRVTAL